MKIHPSALKPDPRRWLALIVVCFGQLMIVLDSTIVNVALPSIQRDLHFSQADLTWVVNAYLITYGSLLLLAGRAGDLIGRKRVFLAGVVVFTAASVLSGFAQTPTELVMARFVQGAGGALSAGVILALIVTGFPKPVERAQAMSIFTFVIAGGGSIGLLAGGLLTESINWHWIFFINLPIGLATFVAGVRLIDETEGIGIGRGVDVIGSALYLQHVKGYTALGTGLAFLPSTIALGVLSTGITARLMRTFGPRALLIPGLATITVALALMATADAQAGYFPGIFGSYLLFGIGAGMSFMPLMTIMMAEVPMADAGVASGVANVSMQVGAALGLAALGTISADHSRSLAAQGASVVGALTGGYQLGFAIAAVCVATALVLVVVVLRSPVRVRVQRPITNPDMSNEDESEAA